MMQTRSALSVLLGVALGAVCMVVPGAAYAQYYVYQQPQYYSPQQYQYQQPSYYGGYASYNPYGSYSMPTYSYASPYVVVNASAGSGAQYPMYQQPVSYQPSYQQPQYYPEQQYQQQQQSYYQQPSYSSGSSYGPGPVGQPTGDTVWGNDMCYYQGYGRAFCGFDPTQKIYDPWTGTWY